jgi:hypothetical protein
MNIVVVVPRKRYEEVARHPIWAVADVRAGRGYELHISPYASWEERCRAEEAFAELLNYVRRRNK